MKFEQARISRKLVQATTSWQSNEAQAKNLRWLAFSYDQGLNGPKKVFEVDCLPSFALSDA